MLQMCVSLCVLDAERVTSIGACNRVRKIIQAIVALQLGLFWRGWTAFTQTRVAMAEERVLGTRIC